ncbi:MAG: acyl carrier protein [Candidatus Omnitrophota bacterium]|jgi:acyl carrier protein
MLIKGVNAVDRQSIKEQLLGIVSKKLELSVSDINENDNLVVALGLDSLNITTLIIEIEEHFKFEFSEDDLLKISDAKSLFEIIEQKAN